MRDYDMLPSIPRALPLVIADAVLAVYTHPRLLVRRTALLLLVLSQLAFVSILLRSPSTPSPFEPPQQHLFRRAKPRSMVNEDPNASRYKPVPPTPAQNAEYVRLKTLIESRSSSYDPSLFEPRSSMSSVHSGRRAEGVAVTAVILHWKRKRGLELILQQISRYPYIREIIIWNNRGLDLVHSDFKLSSPPNSSLGPPTLRIYNSPSNVHDAGKHFACSLATHSHCYFNDDDWLNIYLDSLYTKYLDCCADQIGSSRSTSSNIETLGGRIASNTMPIIHLEHRRWRVSDPDIDLHTGFTWLGTGSFAPRHFSVRFLNQQSAAPVLLTQEQTLVSDMFFSIWSNSYPEQMPNNLVPIDVEGGEVGWSRGADVDQWKVVYGNVLDAIQKLHHTLSLRSPALSPHPFPVTVPPSESHLRAPCASDTCLFSTSLTPFPSPSQLSHPSPSSLLLPSSSVLSRFLFSPLGLGSASEETKWRSEEEGGRIAPTRIEHMHEIEARFNAFEGGWPSDEWWTKSGSWHLAVDGKGEETCWESWRAPEAGDHFGLKLLKHQIVKQIVLVGSTDLENVLMSGEAGLQEGWQLMTLRSMELGTAWDSRSLLRSPVVTAAGSSRIKVVFNLDNSDPSLASIRHFKFVSSGKKRFKLALCSFQVDDERF